MKEDKKKKCCIRDKKIPGIFLIILTAMIAVAREPAKQNVALNPIHTMNASQRQWFLTQLSKSNPTLKKNNSKENKKNSKNKWQ